MSWILGAAATKPPKKQETLKESPSLEFATTVSARGIAPANAVVGHLTASECRFRTVVFFDPGDAIEFTFGLRPEHQVRARGSIVSRTAVGPRFIYKMRLDRMSANEIDELARTVAESHRKRASMRSYEQTIRSLPTTERLTRSNVSSGGLLMTCGEALVEGEPVELRFTLPSEVLAVYPEETALLDLRKGTATPLRSNQRRFEELVIGARVVTHRPLGNGSFSYARRAARAQSSLSRS